MAASKPPGVRQSNEVRLSRAKVIALLGMVALIIAVAVIFGEVRARHVDSRRAELIYFEKRSRALLYQARQRPSGGVIALGDSITELTHFTELCGRPALNAGMTGARLEDIVPLADRIVPIVQPDIVAVAIGINDSRKNYHTPIAAWESAYRRLLKKLAGRRVILIEIQPVEDGKPVGSDYFDRASIAERNRVIRRLGRSFHIPVVAAPASAEGLTEDGAHPNPEGARRWLARVADACPNAEPS